jgi:hypothetical protein
MEASYTYSLPSNWREAAGPAQVVSNSWRILEQAVYISFPATGEKWSDLLRSSAAAGEYWSRISSFYLLQMEN